MKLKYLITTYTLALCLVFSNISYAFGASSIGTVNSLSDKITSELSNQFEMTETHDSVPVLIWTNDIDETELETATLNRMQLSKSDSPNALSTFDILANFADSNASQAQVQAYITSEREAAVDLYTEHNSSFAKKFLSDSQIFYISRYSPVIIAYIDISTAKSLALSDSVRLIDHYPFEKNALSSNSSDYLNVSLNTVNTITNVNYVHNLATYGFTGEGVKIGVLEISLPDTSQFPTLTIPASITYESNTTYTDHANYVLEILSSVAPDAEYYLGASYMTNYDIPVIEDLLDYGVNIISASRSIGGNNSSDHNQYGTIEKWLDHIAYQHSVHFVQAAGNEGSNMVDPGAMAYNIITVGNLYVKNSTDYSVHEIWSGDYASSFYNGTTLARKPDICAPGHGLVTPTGNSGGGSSAATPQVAGAIALLCEQKPVLKTQPNTVKAILTAAVQSSSPHTYVPSQTLYRSYGAGLLDCASACGAVANNTHTYAYIASDVTSKTHSFRVNSNSSNIRVSLVYCIKSQGAGDHSSNQITTSQLVNLNLIVRDPNGNFVASSVTTNNNVEIVDFLPSMIGTYTIEVNRVDSSTELLFYSLAWR